MPWPERACVVGGGTMGAGFVQLLALGGCECTLADVSLAVASSARTRAIRAAERFAAAGLVDADAADRVTSAVAACESVEDAVGGASLVVEAVTEDQDVKRATLARIEAAAPPEAIIATNTSAIPIATLAAPLARPERFLGAHWFNPPQWVPCVEVIPGPATADDATTAVVALLRRLGKRPTVVGDSAGFVANRIQFAMFREAAAVVSEGIASAEAVDEIVRSSFGFRLPFLGPFAIADMAGLDVYLGAYRALEADHAMEPPALLRALVQDGRFGTKAGGGFVSREATRHDLDAAVARRDRAYHALARLIEQIGAWEVHSTEPRGER